MYDKYKNLSFFSQNNQYCFMWYCKTYNNCTKDSTGILKNLESFQKILDKTCFANILT